MKLIFTWIKNRLFVHWITTLKAITYLVLTFMLYEGKISVAEWGTAIGTVMGLANLFAKDIEKTVTKSRFSSNVNLKENKADDDV